MIESDEQLAITIEWAARFRAALMDYDRDEALASGRAPELIEAELAALTSQLADLDREIEHYRRRKARR